MDVIAQFRVKRDVNREQFGELLLLFANPFSSGEREFCAQCRPMVVGNVARANSLSPALGIGCWQTVSRTS